MNGISATNAKKNEQISRYEMTRILNAIDCEDYMITSPWMKNYYTKGYRDTFLQDPDHNFKDIQYLEENTKKQSYYYCVAYVGDEEREYMQ